VTKEEQLYRQDYCGCVFGLTMQREQQDKLMDEMFSPICGSILPASIEERIAMYTHRNEIEDEGKEYKIVKQKFLNYRQLNFKLLKGKTVVLDGYALSYSTLPRGRAQGKIEYSLKNIHYFNREEIKFITLAFYNEQNKTEYKTVKELIYNPLTQEKELLFRVKLNATNYDLSPIIVVEDIPEGKLTIRLETKTYEDTKEKLIIL